MHAHLAVQCSSTVQYSAAWRGAAGRPPRPHASTRHAVHAVHAVRGYALSRRTRPRRSRGVTEKVRCTPRDPTTLVRSAPSVGRGSAGSARSGQHTCSSPVRLQSWRRRGGGGGGRITTSPRHRGLAEESAPLRTDPLALRAPLAPRGEKVTPPSGPPRHWAARRQSQWRAVGSTSTRGAIEQTRLA